MRNEINRKLNKLAELERKKIEIEREQKELEREIYIIEKKKKTEFKKQHPYLKKRCFIRELNQGGVSVAKIAREGGISYYKARQIKLGKKKLRSNTPEYRKIRNLHRRIGYQQLRAKGVSPKDAQRLRRHKLRREPIFKKVRGRFQGYEMKAELSIKLFNNVFIEKFTSQIIIKNDKKIMRLDIIRQVKIKYGYDIKVEFIKEVITKIYDN